MHTFSVSSPAKLNLFLHITGKRADGYHNLQTVFCRLNLSDTLTFSPNLDPSAPIVSLTGGEWLTDNVADNLIHKAVHTLARHAQQINHPIFPVNIHLDKRLPTGAGLGGGSSNAGTTLLALNRLWQLRLSTAELIGIAQTLGADVPFFVLDTPYAIAEGIGERLTPIDLPAQQFLLLCPEVHSPTAKLFSRPELKKDSPVLSHATLIDNQSHYLTTLQPPFYNAFEAIALQTPAIKTAYDYLASLPTHATPRLTGTGSAVFLPIAPDIDKETLVHWQNNAPSTGFLVGSG